MNKYRLLYSLILIFSILLVSFFGLCFVFILSNSNIIRSISSVHKYKGRTFNPFTNKTTTGIVEMSNLIGKNEFLSFYDEQTNEHVLISNFGSPEYKCSGLCYCEDDNNNNNNINNRRNVGALHRVFSYLLVAASSVIAINLAREYFEDECSRMFQEAGEECKEKSLLSKVVNCVKEATEEAIMEEEEDGGNEYMCEGTCLPTNLDFQYSDFGLEKNFNHDSFCEKFKESAIVNTREVHDTFLPLMFDGVEESVLVTHYFIAQHMDYHCRVHSEIGMMNDEESDFKLPYQTKINFCVGHDPSRKGHSWTNTFHKSRCELLSR